MEKIKPQFILTPEDVNTIKLMAFLSFEYLDFQVQCSPNTKEECQEDVDKINELLNRIQQWHDEIHNEENSGA